MPPQITGRIASVGFPLEYDPVTPETLDAAREYSSRADLTKALHDLLLNGLIRPREWNTLVRGYELLNPDAAHLTKVHPGTGATRDELDLIGALPARPRGVRHSYDYWGPRGFVLDAPVAPGVDYYRLVGSDDEAAAALGAGEPPLHGHRGMTPAQLNQQQMLQWEGPNRLFNRTTRGDVGSMDEEGGAGAFVPIWNTEGERGDPRERPRLEEHLRRTYPDLLRPPALLPPASSRSAAPRADLAAAFRPERADLARPLRVAGGEKILDLYHDMRQRADRRIPSQREGDISVPPFHEPDRAFPMPSVVPLDSLPTTPPGMPYDVPRGRPPVERADGMIPLAQAWPQLLGRIG